MPTSTQTQPQLNATTRTVANQLLTWLAEHVEANANAVMADTLNETELGQAEATIGRLEVTPLGAYRGSTSALKAAALHDDVSGETAQEAIGALKAAGRIVQCGRGRGKCLLLLDATLFDETTPTGRTRRARPAAPSPQPRRATAGVTNGATHQPVAGELLHGVGELLDSLLGAVTDLGERVGKLEQSVTSTEGAMTEVRTYVDQTISGLKDALNDALNTRLTW